MRYKQDLAEFISLAAGARLIEERAALSEDEAREDIVSAIRDGALKTRWWRVSRGERSQCSASNLPHGFLNNLTPNNIDWGTSIARHRSIYVPFTVEIEVKRDDLSQLYPLLDDDGDGGASTIGAETRCKQWLISLMNGDDGPKKAKAAYKTEAQKFGVGTKAFDRAWSSAVAKTGNTAWSKPGRKS